MKNHWTARKIRINPYACLAHREQPLALLAMMPSTRPITAGRLANRKKRSVEQFWLARKGEEQRDE